MTGAPRIESALCRLTGLLRRLMRRRPAAPASPWPVLAADELGRPLVLTRYPTAEEMRRPPRVHADAEPD